MFESARFRQNGNPKAIPDHLQWYRDPVSRIEPEKLAPLLLFALAVACGDDGGGATESDTEPSATSEVTLSTSISASASASGPGTTGTESDTETATNTGDTEPAESSSSSGAPNEDPQAQNDAYTVFYAEMPFSADVEAGVLSNDADPDDDPLTVTAFDDPSTLGLVVDVAEDGAFTYAAATDFWGGPDSFTYTISDGRGGEATASVDLLVVPDLVPLGSVRGGVNGFAIDGVASDSGVGFSVAAGGDVNDDGLDDVILGAPGRAGVYVVFGKEDGDVVDLSDLENESGGGFLIVGTNNDDGVGVAVAGGIDVNDDGMDDIIIGAPESDVSAANAGFSYVVFGKADFTSVALSDLESESGGGFGIAGELNSDRSGSSVAAIGDVNDDGFDDVAIGAPEANPNGGDSGRVYVVFGTDGTDIVLLADVAVGTGGFPIDGTVASGFVGDTLSGVGDVDGDLVPDLLIGAQLEGPNGTAYLVLGKDTGTAVLLNGSGSGAFAITGEGEGDDAGSCVGPAGDVDGDGLADLVIGAHEAGNDAGAAYVVFGKDDTDAVPLGDVAGGTGGYKIAAPDDERLGFGCGGGGDVNGDGVPDIVIGAIPVPGGAGRTFVVHGKDDGTQVEVADLIQGDGGFALDGENDFDVAGLSVANAGDVNGDGFGDVLIGAAGYPAGDDAGRAYVVFGTPSALPEG